MQNTESRFVQFVVFRLDRAWFLLDESTRKNQKEGFIKEFSGSGSVRAYSYLVRGLEPKADMMLWLSCNDADESQEFVTRLLRTRLGAYLEVVASLISVTDSSEYVRSHDAQSQSLNSEQRSKYLIVYPFTKTPEWYLLGHEERGEMMKEHAQIGRGFGSVRQILGYSFGFDDQEFVVAYEADSIREYKELVRSLRGIRVRKYTLRETPVFLGVYRAMPQIMEMLG
ncbi:MAG: chlorite dismutase family protein [Candidatus Micrarchaeota archaeon]|nr:chlorite dismutase family protein [Candidatus Micrarchaeota archaeon]MDE1804228.1 chlorite dismutase family protein [Candidatus Micrarchaeota archaeon]MDE1846684.1 chlorite dismutase family protein [Candidatus Micrarchaeota archaeon]